MAARVEPTLMPLALDAPEERRPRAIFRMLYVPITLPRDRKRRSSEAMQRSSSNTLRDGELRALDELRPHELQRDKLVLSAR